MKSTGGLGGAARSGWSAGLQSTGVDDFRWHALTKRNLHPLLGLRSLLCTRFRSSPARGASGYRRGGSSSEDCFLSSVRCTVRYLSSMFTAHKMRRLDEFEYFSEVRLRRILQEIGATRS